MSIGNAEIIVTPLNPITGTDKIHGFLYIYGSYVKYYSPYTLTSNYQNNTISVRGNQELAGNENLGNFWNQGIIQVNLNGIAIDSKKQVLIIIGVHSVYPIDRPINVQAFSGSTFKGDFDLDPEDDKFIFIIPPFQGYHSIFIRPTKLGDVIGFRNVEVIIV